MRDGHEFPGGVVDGEVESCQLLRREKVCGDQKQSEQAEVAYEIVLHVGASKSGDAAMRGPLL
jgi:hypothetical protein